MVYIKLRRRVYWAEHQVPTQLQGKLRGIAGPQGRRFSKSLGTSDKTEAKRLASLLWLHDWSRKLTGEADRVNKDREALFFRDLMRNAETEEERETIRDYIIDKAWDRRDRARSQGDIAGEEAADRLVGIATGKLTPLAEHLDGWLAAIPDTEKTKAMKRAEVLKLTKAYEHVQEITPQVAQQWLETLAKGAGAKTIGRILSFLRGYWRHLKAKGVIQTDPWSGLTMPSTVNKRRRSGWIPFAPEQVVALRERAAEIEDHELVDLIDMARWSGARIEELCSLEVANVDLMRSQSFKVTDSKTEAGIREVPIHAELMPTLKRLVGSRTSGYVLADLSANKYGDRSNAIGKRFGRLKGPKGAGLGDGYVFHSIRKCVVTLLEDAGVSENLAADIVGHEKPRITYGLYSGGASLETKRAALAKLSYPAALKATK